MALTTINVLKSTLKYQAKRLLIPAILFLMCFHDTAEAQNSSAIPEFDTFGTLRTVFTTDQIRAQDGTRGESSALNARIHLGARATFSDRFYLQSRFATRLSTTQSDFRFFVRDYTPGGGSYPAGTATIDELFAAWDAADRLHIRVGRFQGRFPLEGFIPKGMDRYYAANLSISHTDGVWLRQDLSYRYRLHFIASRNSERGSSHAARRPLSFSDSASRYTLFANLEHRNKSGLWAQRELSVSYTRNNFVRDGSLKDHLTFSGRAMARLPFNPGTGEYLIGGELGFIPLAPDPSSGGIAVSEDNTMFGSSSVAWQLSAYANKLFDKHYLGILYGQTDPHWFVSSSFTPNTTMSEIRYRFVISSSLNYEMRFRIRTDLFKPENAPFTTRINDFYARFTYRF